ncbi:Type 1 glutamine amidotransferase-like domain-containing protein [Skermania piniformis]|uniref:Peptidase E n=1 Tax=Skermania pinensis TaxID=39122 RepID=A0ABX8SC10_9ACTN|nr:Type 1 glutamine amidotransferase-like domain-containing protein [Skermania piniformis]QXQ14712.1 peptidase E [Skermania piniformis]
MRLFLAGYRFGAHRDRFVALAGGSGPVAVVANACDAWPPAARSAAVAGDLGPLRSLGFTAREIDLRRDPATALADFPVVWVRGGNTFVLRAAFARSNADTVAVDLIRQNALVYAGYSAGACLLAPSLTGLELLDDPADAGPELRWDGLGLIAASIVPHHRSPLDIDGGAERLIARYRAADITHLPLTDDEVLVVDGDAGTVLH